MTKDQRKKIIARCNAELKKNPNCIWAKNELKYLDVQNLSLPICEGGMAYKADNDYHGGYVE